MGRRHLAVCTCPQGRNGDALVNCYESRSEAASTRYYRYKRNGNGDPEPAAVSEANVEAEAEATQATEVKESEAKVEAVKATTEAKAST